MKAKVGLIGLLIISFYILTAFLKPFPSRTNFNDNKQQPIGFSYSFEQAGWYGLDTRKLYVELLDMGFDWVRIPFHWDLMTDSSGNLKISDIEYAVAEAKKKDVKVIIALGVKTPYYPEFHLPKDIKDQIKFGEVVDDKHPIADDVLEMNRKLVAALSKYDNISHWQIENEPFTANINRIVVDQSLIEKEIEVVREADFRKRPIMLSHVGPASFDNRWENLLNLLEPGDALGVNAYFKTQGVDLFAFEFLGNQINIAWPGWFSWPVQSWKFLSPDYEAIIKEAKERKIDVWVTEMQAEPYVRSLEYAKAGDFAYNSSDILKSYDYLSGFNFDGIGFWGAHFWQFRKAQNDSSWIESVEKILEKD